ncbi:hypothetical protein CEXT_709811 [Caerostris extrusa]|uniref:Uncharacterized protein n=1 Tax=Caerostris extrusa TaxID=172846 RepID=A0AAV4M366_CAEEX|nr:hypothetical protein CEXT_709811 [Caerostris extrusa]
MLTSYKKDRNHCSRAFKPLIERQLQQADQLTGDDYVKYDQCPCFVSLLILQYFYCETNLSTPCFQFAFMISLLLPGVVVPHIHLDSWTTFLAKLYKNECLLAQCQLSVKANETEG